MHVRLFVRTLCAAGLSAFLAGAFPGAASAARCEAFADLRASIDMVIKTDPVKSATFRSEVQSGADSLYMLEQLAGEDMVPKLDVCRFEVVEYLTKLGFPPAH